MSDPTSFLDGRVILHAGDCLQVLKGVASNSVDAIVTDPPYGISFMGRADWDGAGPDQRAFSRAFWRECLRVLKPGGHLIAFSAARTYHRLACAVEDGGFEIRDALWQLIEAEAGVAAFLASLDPAQADALRRLCEGADFGGILGWVFGSGFPKGGDLAKVIDKHLGVEGTFGAPKSAAHAEWIARGAMRGEGGHDGYQRPWMDDPEAVERAARLYVGGCEASRRWSGFGPALKPAIEPAALARKPLEGTLAANILKHGVGALNIDACRVPMSEEDQQYIAERIGGFNNTQSIGGDAALGGGETMDRSAAYDASRGRFPAHLILDESAEVCGAFPVDDRGSAARFFWSAKADDVDRIGLEHPTIKPLDLMQHCVRLVVPPGGLVLDPFAGTGTTGEAAFREGMRAVLIERDPKHCGMIAKRMAYAVSSLDARRTEARRAKAARKAAAGGAAKASAALDLFA